MAEEMAVETRVLMEISKQVQQKAILQSFAMDIHQFWDQSKNWCGVFQKYVALNRVPTFFSL